jgi:hypothetical protein
MNLRLTALVGVAAAALVAASATPAFADTTAATFDLTGGAITMTTAPLAALSNGVTGAASISGSLGAVTVSDLRGREEGWAVSAASSTFVGEDGGTISTGVSYDSGDATASTGTGTFDTDGATAMTTTAAPVFTANTSGNNTASFTPTLTVSLPANALVDTYDGTVTTSVL